MERSLRVDISELTPGCIISESVFGKTSHPIIEKDTVLTEDHIEILERFLIESVSVSMKREDGQPLVLSNKLVKKGIQHHVLHKKEENSFDDFSTHYLTVVDSSERIFNHWCNNMPIDMPVLRKLIIPLIELIENESIDVYNLYTYSSKEKYVYHHLVGVSVLSAFLAKKMGYEKGEWIQIGLAGFLSNCGLSKIDSVTLNKPLPLNKEERDLIKKHPVYSYRLIESIRTITDAVKLAVLQHHERLDGSGYPLALKKGKIHQYARIIAVSDTYHAMTNERPYQEKKTPLTVLSELQKNESLKLDPKVIQVLVNHYPRLR